MNQKIQNLWKGNGTFPMINYDVRNEIIYKTEVLTSNLCNYNNPYISIRCDITVTAAPVTQVLFKDCAPFTKCITKTEGITIDNAEDLDLVNVQSGRI